MQGDLQNEFQLGKVNKIFVGGTSDLQNFRDAESSLTFLEKLLTRVFQATILSAQGTRLKLPNFFNVQTSGNVINFSALNNIIINQMSNHLS